MLVGRSAATPEMRSPSDRCRSDPQELENVDLEPTQCVPLTRFPPRIQELEGGCRPPLVNCSRDHFRDSAGVDRFLQEVSCRHPHRRVGSVLGRSKAEDLCPSPGAKDATDEVGQEVELDIAHVGYFRHEPVDDRDEAEFFVRFPHDRPFQRFALFHCTSGKEVVEIPTAPPFDQRDRLLS